MDQFQLDEKLFLEGQRVRTLAGKHGRSSTEPTYAAAFAGLWRRTVN
jgi:hypothetical protein